MRIYSDHVLPCLIDLVMRGKVEAEDRAKVVPLASGIVAEIGSGSGLNARFFSDAVERVYALDPSQALWRLGRARLDHARVPIQVIMASGEAIPLPAESVDTALMTWTLCSIPDASRALREIRRILKPTGRLVFVEHGRAPDTSVRRWQDRLNPRWRRLAGGCNLNRPIDTLIEREGFRIVHCERGYRPGHGRSVTCTEGLPKEDDVMMYGGMMLMMVMGTLLSLLILGAHVAGVWWCVRRSSPALRDRALERLRERYARGEITREEFEACRRDLVA